MLGSSGRGADRRLDVPPLSGEGGEGREVQLSLSCYGYSRRRKRIHAEKRVDDWFRALGGLEIIMHLAFNSMAPFPPPPPPQPHPWRDLIEDGELLWSDTLIMHFYAGSLSVCTLICARLRPNQSIAGGQNDHAVGIPHYFLSFFLSLSLFLSFCLQPCPSPQSQNRRPK